MVLVHPGSRARIYQSLGENLSAIDTPVWVSILGGFIRSRGYSVEVLDSEAEDLNPDESAERLVDMNPLLTAVIVYGHQPSASTQNMTVAGEICTALKERAPDLKSILVGGHVAALPETTLREETADFVASGEGPYTIMDLLEALKSGRPELEKVRGLLYRDGPNIRTNPPAPLVQNLDQEVPALVWDLLPMGKYRAHNWHCFGDLQRQPYASLYTTLGCPYHCTFCCIQAPFKSGESASGFKLAVNSYRFWSPDWVIKQIDTLVNQYGVRNIRVADEMFVLNQKHVEQICDLLIARHYDLNLWAYARVDTVRSDETLDKLKKAGFNWLSFGFESANETVRSDVEKSYAQESVVNTVERVRDTGIFLLGNYIFGLPEDDLSTMQQTLDMALALNCEFANIYCAMAYPGSQLYLQAVEKRWELPDKWTGYSQHSVDTLPVPTNYVSASQVLSFRDHAWQSYFGNSDYLAMIHRKFGPETVQQIREMASHTLERRNA